MQQPTTTTLRKRVVDRPPAPAPQHFLRRSQIIGYLVNCMVRDMVLLLNVGPDRHGQIPPLVEQNLREMGVWLAQVGEAIYGTQGGPWQPKDGQYGFCRKGSTIYIHSLGIDREKNPADTILAMRFDRDVMT